jgi:hypothetical protein
MVVQPGVEVKSVPDAAAPEAHGWNAKAIEESDSDAEVLRCLFLRETASGGARKCGFIHGSDVEPDV